MRSRGAFGCLVVLAVAPVQATATEPLVGALYFGDWHVDPQMSALHGKNWTEWQLVSRATPRWRGHMQPNVPLDDPKHGFGLRAPENDPEAMASSQSVLSPWYLSYWSDR